MNRMVAVLERMEKAGSKVDFKCEMCLTGKVEGFCRQCTEFICLECAKQHQRMKAKYPDHKIATLEELRTGGVKSFPAEQAPARICQVHNEQRKVYCYNCKELICRDCTLVDHAGHKYDFVVKGAPQVKTTLRDRLVPLRGCITGITDAVKFIGDSKTQNIEQGTSVDAAITQYCKELRQIIDRRENELLEASAALVQNNVEALSAQEKSLASSATVVQDLVEFVDQTLENATDEELMEVSDQVLTRIEEEILKQTTLELKPPEISKLNVCFESKGKFIETIQRSIYVPPRAISAISAISGAVVKEPAYIHVQTVDDTPAEVKASLKSLYNHSVLQFKGEQKELGKYEIVYTPVIQGQHELEITVDGVPVYNKPLLVRITPTKLSKPVRIIPDLEEPVGVAINSAGEVLVSEGEGGVNVFDKYGLKIQKLKSSEFSFENPFGIAVDAADDIYVTDSLCCISKISKAGQLVKKVGRCGSGPGELRTPRGLAVIDNQLYVCDQGNDRVQVFSLDLEFIRMFGQKRTGCGFMGFPVWKLFFHPQAIAADEDGLLYISDDINNCVHVLTKEGNFVRSISGKIGDHHLSRPSGLCVVGQYLYVVHQMDDDDDESSDDESSDAGDSSDDGDAGDPGDAGDADDDGDAGDSGDAGDGDDSGDGSDGDAGDGGDSGDSDGGDAGDGGDGTVVVVLDKDSGEFVSQFGEGELKYVDCHSISVNSDGFVYVCSEDRVVVF